MREQQARELDPAARGSLDERCPAVVVPGVDIGALVEQQLDRLDTVVRRGEQNGRVAFPVAARAQTRRQQRAHHVGMTLGGREHQLAISDRRPSRLQRVERAGLPGRRRVGGCGAAGGVSGSDIGAAREQRLHDRNVSVAGGRHQRRSPFVVFGGTIATSAAYTPTLLRLVPTVTGDVRVRADFRTELMSYKPGELVFQIVLPKEGRVGTLTLGQPVLSAVCDTELHFHHHPAR